jgi:hypothetical protein
MCLNISKGVVDAVQYLKDVTMLKSPVYLELLCPIDSPRLVARGDKRVRHYFMSKKNKGVKQGYQLSPHRYCRVVTTQL